MFLSSLDSLGARLGHENFRSKLWLFSKCGGREALKDCLAETGFELTEAIEKADAVVVNTCAVTGPTENRIHLLKHVPDEKRALCTRSSSASRPC